MDLITARILIPIQSRHDLPQDKLDWISTGLFESIINHPAIPTRR